ncbi:hypothetical protein NPIL_662031 [Nephila pilipes]|uniref:Uncharacterized protein n=1 Tax=Nephila pilipes TaxID=299642 RepID=A0A8X6P6I1_NEPPI|nr:hypothetical protein NPIL_662031 [Nephila pilipes]
MARCIGDIRANIDLFISSQSYPQTDEDLNIDASPGWLPMSSSPAPAPFQSFFEKRIMQQNRSEANVTEKAWRFKRMVLCKKKCSTAVRKLSTINAAANCHSKFFQPSSMRLRNVKDAAFYDPESDSAAYLLHI